ncbi:MAG: c-type cytochrome [Gammaproteobacteria bacterium]|nr:c-type cytochrome [Gammaproteobacteria bacterium]
MKYHLLMLAAFTTVLAACSEPADSENKKQAESPAVVSSKHIRITDSEQIRRGKKVFQQNCAICHGAKGEGKSPAPPLNGSGHAWHHSSQMNRRTISDGTKHLGGTMPAWKDKLSEQEITDVMAWFQSKWSDEIYQLWYEKVESKNK